VVGEVDDAESTEENVRWEMPPWPEVFTGNFTQVIGTPGNKAAVLVPDDGRLQIRENHGIDVTFRSALVPDSHPNDARAVESHESTPDRVSIRGGYCHRQHLRNPTTGRELLRRSIDDCHPLRAIIAQL
jgi:hypothetical protein